VLLSSSGNVSLDQPTSPSLPESPTTSQVVQRNQQKGLLEEMEGFSSELLDEASDSESSSRRNSETTEIADTVITNDGTLELEDSSQEIDREDSTEEPSPMYLRRFRKKLIKSFGSPKESIGASDVKAADKRDDSSSAAVEARSGGGGSLISSFIRSIASPFSKANPVEASSLANVKGKGRGVTAPMDIGDERAKQKALMSRILLFSKQSSKCQVNDNIHATAQHALS
jgi:hypothetical protein